MNKEGDLVLIYHEGNPSIYARIEAIEFDIKKDWYQVTMLLLTVPVQTVTWILREEYINGAVFTMGGHSMKIEKIDSLVMARSSGEQKVKDEENQAKGSEKGKLIKFNKGKKD